MFDETPTNDIKKEDLEELEDDLKEATLSSVFLGKEKGMAICETDEGLRTGEVESGDAMGVDVSSTCGDDVQVGTFHTHPREESDPSIMDISITVDKALDLICIGSGEVEDEQWDEIEVNIRCFKPKKNLGKELKKYRARQEDMSEFYEKKKRKQIIAEEKMIKGQPFDSLSDLERPPFINEREPKEQVKERIQDEVIMNGLEQVYDETFVETFEV